MELSWAAVSAIVIAASTFVGVFVQIGKIWKAVEDAAVVTAATSGKLDLLRADVSEHKVDVARNYATNADVERAIDRLESTLRQYLDAVQRTR